MPRESDLPPMYDERTKPTKDEIKQKCREIFGKTADLAITESEDSIEFNVYSDEFIGFARETMIVCHILLAGIIQKRGYYNPKENTQQMISEDRPYSSFVLGKMVKTSQHNPNLIFEQIHKIVINASNTVEAVIAQFIDTAKVIKRLKQVTQNTMALEIAREAVSMSLTRETINAFLNPIINNINVELQKNSLKFGEISNASSITYQAECAITAAIKSRLKEISVDIGSQNLVLRSQLFMPNTHYGKKLNLLDIEQSLSRILEGNVRR
jgi:hypothetical protein